MKSESSSEAQADIAYVAGMTPETLSRILSAEHVRASFESIAKIAHVAGVSVGWVLEEPGFSLTDEQRARVRTARVLLLNLTRRVAEVVSSWSLLPDVRHVRRNPACVARSVRHVGASLIHVPESVSSCSRSVRVRGLECVLRSPECALRRSECIVAYACTRIPVGCTWISLART